MKKILFLIILFPFLIKGQGTLPCALPTATSTSTSSTLLISEGSCVAGSTKKIPIANFIATYSLITRTTFTVSTISQNTVTIAGAGINIVTGTYPNFTITATETQTLSISGSTISLSGGSSVTIPTYVSDRTVTITGAGISVATGTYPTFTITSTEAQTLSISSNTITISGTNSYVTINDQVVWSTSLNPTGFSVISIQTSRYSIIGSTVFFDALINGTSNATTFTFTLPFAPTLSMIFIVSVMDNGVNRGGRMDIAAASTTATLFIDGAGTAFTASGSKTARVSIFYRK